MNKHSEIDQVGSDIARTLLALVRFTWSALGVYLNGKSGLIVYKSLQCAMA